MAFAQRVFSGVQPTGNLHLGNYLGAIVNFVKMQETHNCIYCVVDMRMTEQRRVIARVLADSVDHPDVEELYRRCVAVDDKISISTVYRTVKLFEDAGIIERHDFREGRARYEQMPDSHHDHLINLRDGKVIEFTSEEIEKLQAEKIGRAHV